MIRNIAKKENKDNKYWYVGIYTRRSFDDQEDIESNTITNQKELINDYLRRNKNMILVNFYTDDGYTGTDFNRPGFNEMMEDIYNGKINTIIVKDLSRLGRNYLEVGRYLEVIFPQNNVRVISINDGVDSYLNPESINNLIIPIKNLINETYARDISQKVTSAYKAMALNGKFVSGTPPYGYAIDKEDKHHLVIDEEEAIIVRKIFDMALQGEGRISICKYLNMNGILCRKELKRRTKAKLSLEPFEVPSRYLWSTSSIGRMLVNETYIGNLSQLKTKRKSFKNHSQINIDKEEWIVVKNTHEPIISIEDFNKVQEIISSRKPRRRTEKLYSIYNGKLKCGDCNRSLIKVGRPDLNREIPKFCCMSYLHLGSCTPHKIYVADLEKTVLEAIQLQVKLVIELDRSLNKLLFKKNRESMEEEYKEKVKLYDIKKKRLNEKKRIAYESWKLNESEKVDFVKVNNEVNNEIRLLDEDLELFTSTYRENLKKVKSNDYWIGHFKRNKRIKKLTKNILDELIDKIYVFEDGNIKIDFKYSDEYEQLLNYLMEQGVTVECKNGELVYI